VSQRPAPVAVVDQTPTRLVIPRINLDAAIETRGLDSNRNMLSAKDFHHAAWYDLGPTPGQPGDALINGHVSWWTGDAVFTRLSQIRKGDEVIVIRADGTSIRFKVTAKRTVAWSARVASLFAPSSVATLTLITCTGTWDPLIQSDTQRLLVSAVLE
jgi:LPXTG-site transpeptidase (sortase) family protein